MIGFCDENSVPVDFISTHTYGVKQGFLDEYGTSGTILDPDEWSLSGEIINSRKQIDGSAKPGLELHYTEWSSSYTPSDPIHDSYHQAAYILQKLKQIDDAVDSMSYWVFTDIFEEAGPRFTPFHGGFGLLNYQGIKKPSYHTYYLLNKLGDIELQNADDQSWVCRNSAGGLQLLFWDFTITHPGDAELNQTYYIKDLPSKSKGMVEININNIPDGRYDLEIYRIGYKSNDAYATYLSMGRPRQLSVRQVEAIKSLNNCEPVLTEEVIVDSKREIDINENDVFLLNFIKR